jgi:hypothetical protein
MKKQQSTHLTMHLNNQAVQNENAGKFESFTAYPALKAEIDQSISDEQALANSQESRKRNSTAAKDFAKNAAGEYIIDLSSKESAYAVVSGNKTLLDKVRFLPSIVKKSSDIQHVQFMETLLTCAGEDPESFLEYGVTEDYLSEGQNLLDNLKVEMQNLLLNNSEQKQLTEQLEQQFKTTDAALVTVDAMVDTMRKSDPVFHRLYWHSRKIKKTATSKLSVWGKVFDAATLTYLRRAKVSFRSFDGSKAAAGSDLAKNVKFTGEAGGFHLKSLATGTYVFTVTYAGYADQEVTVYINAGVLTRIDIPLTKLSE